MTTRLNWFPAKKRDLERGQLQKIALCLYGKTRAISCKGQLKQNIYRYSFNFKTCLDYAERPHPGNQLPFTLYECCMNWYSHGVIRSSHRIRTRSRPIRIVVKFYNHTLQLRYGCIPTQYFPLSVLLEGITFIKNQSSLTNSGSL